MSRRPRHHQLRLHDILTLGATVFLLLCLELSFSGGVASRGSVVPASSTVEAYGLPVSGPQPLVLTGQRSFAVLTGLSDARQRPGQLVQTHGLALVAAAGFSQGALPAVHVQAPLVQARGLLAVRAPPVLAV
jgi:hypothetical protein